MMIKIGNVYINPDEVAAMYPSIHTEGKIWIVLKGGRSVWTLADMEEAKRWLCEHGIPFDDTDTLQAAELYASGYRYIARDAGMRLCAYESCPVRAEDFWYSESGETCEIRPESFKHVLWEDPKPVSLYNFLTGEGA